MKNVTKFKDQDELINYFKNNERLPDKFEIEDESLIAFLLFDYEVDKDIEETSRHFIYTRVIVDVKQYLLDTVGKEGGIDECFYSAVYGDAKSEIGDDDLGFVIFYKTRKVKKIIEVWE